MELLGKSLEELFNKSQKKKMSIRCVCNLGIQMIKILKTIHDKHIIHRDIKPDNFVLGINENKKKIYLLDFGLAKKYRSSTTLNHYPISSNKRLTGTPRYASINALTGIEQSRRDDLESLGYVLLYFLRGNLPWQGLPIKSGRNKYEKILEKKKETSSKDLCFGFPNEFEIFIDYCRNLKYEEEPQYFYLENLFLNVLKKDNFKFDFFYDWDNNINNNFIGREFLNEEIEKNKVDDNVLNKRENKEKIGFITPVKNEENNNKKSDSSSENSYEKKK